MSLMIASGSSLRGLSLVTIAKSACASTTAPMRGRLVLSRFPPQPKTTMSRAGFRSRQRLDDIEQRVVGVRVVDENANCRCPGTAWSRPGTAARRPARGRSGAHIRHSHRPGSGNCRERIVDVECADQRQAHEVALSVGIELIAGAVKIDADIARAEISPCALPIGDDRDWSLFPSKPTSR
jgi:hypothetical protein